MASLFPQVEAIFVFWHGPSYWARSSRRDKAGWPVSPGAWATDRWDFYVNSDGALTPAPPSPSVLVSFLLLWAIPWPKQSGGNGLISAYSSQPMVERSQAGTQARKPESGTEEAMGKCQGDSPWLPQRSLLFSPDHRHQALSHRSFITEMPPTALRPGQSDGAIFWLALPLPKRLRSCQVNNTKQHIALPFLWHPPCLFLNLSSCFCCADEGKLL